MLSKLASRRVCTARRTSSGEATRSSTESSRGVNDWAPSDTRVTPHSRRSTTSAGVTVSGFASTVSSAAAGNAPNSRRSATPSVNVGVPPPTKTERERRGEHPSLPLELAEQRVDVGGVCPVCVPADDGDEVAVPAPVGAEREVDVEVPDRVGAGVPHGPPRAGHRWNRVHTRSGTTYFFLSPSRLSTARNASCGTSTPPTCFIRFLPFFCFSISFRLRVMSPP